MQPLPLLTLLLADVCLGEWELPEELWPPESWFTRVHGYSACLGFVHLSSTTLKSAVQIYLSSSIDTKYAMLQMPEVPFSKRGLPCLLSASASPVCFRATENRQLARTDLRSELNCSTFTLSETTIRVPDADGNCQLMTELTGAVDVDWSTYCRESCAGDDEVVRLLGSAEVSDEGRVCDCSGCLPIARDENANSTEELTASHQIDMILSDSRLKSVISRDAERTLPVCGELFSTRVRFQEEQRVPLLARFWLQRGRFQCPSEVTCWRELFYVFWQTDPVFEPALLYTIKLILIVMHLVLFDRPLAYYWNKLLL